MNPPEPVNDHRRMRRRSTKMTTTVICRKGTLGLGPNRGVRVFNISEDGIELLVSEAMEKGDEIEVSLTPLGVSKAIVRLAIVVWCSPHEGDQFLVGAKFFAPLTYTDMYYMT